jgi:hypothetical protein
MKLIQIDFNAELIGQDGIVVKTGKGKEVQQLTFFKIKNTFPLMGVLDDEFATWTKDGKFDTTVQPTYDLIMYKEVEVLTVDEWIGKNSSTEHEYKTWVKVGMNMLAAAIKRGEVE